MNPPAYKIITVPRESTIDENVLIVELPVKNGGAIKKGETLAVFETTKSAFTLEAPCDGFLFYTIKPQASVKVGDVLAVIAGAADFKLDLAKEMRTTEHPLGAAVTPSKTRFSESALRIIRERGLDPRQFAHRVTVTANDVLHSLEPSPHGETKETRPISEKSIVLLGGGRHAKMCIDLLRQTQTHEIYGILDSHTETGQLVMGVPIVGPDRSLEDWRRKGLRYAVNAVGGIHNHPVREEVFKRIKKAGFELPNLIHPSAVLEPSVSLGDGNQLMAHALIGSASRIGNNCIINSGAIVSHDCVLHDNVHLAPGSTLAGGVQIGKNTLIGMGVTLYMDVKVGANVTIHNGCHITQHIPDNTVVRYERHA